MLHYFDDPASDDGDYIPLTKEERKCIYLTAIICLAITGIAGFIITRL